MSLYFRRLYFPSSAHLVYTLPSLKYILVRENLGKRRENQTAALRKLGFIKRVDKGRITSVKDFKSWRFEG